MDLISKIKIGALIVAALMWLYSWYMIRSLRADNKQLKLAADLAASENKGLMRELEANRVALEKREASRAELAAEREAILNELDEIYKSDQDGAAWADASLPDAVRERLRK